MHYGFEKNTRDILLKNQGEETITTIEQIKEEAKKRFQKDLTDEQAQAWLEAHPAGELQDEELENVAGCGCGWGKLEACERCGCSEYDWRGNPNVAPYCKNCGLLYGELKYAGK